MIANARKTARFTLRISPRMVAKFRKTAGKEGFSQDRLFSEMFSAYEEREAARLEKQKIGSSTGRTLDRPNSEEATK